MLGTFTNVRIKTLQVWLNNISEIVEKELPVGESEREWVEHVEL